MSMEWIKMRPELLYEPKVVRMANALGVSRYQMVGYLLAVWGVADRFAEIRETRQMSSREHDKCRDDNTTFDGHLSGYTASMIDAIVGHEGLCDQLEAVGWVKVYHDGISFHDWDVHHSKSARKRACDAKSAQRRRLTRQMSSREHDKCRDDNTTPTLIIEKRKENIIPLPPLPEKPKPEPAPPLPTPEARLTASWIFYGKGLGRALRDPTTLGEFFAELLRQGHTEEAIQKRIADPERDRSQPHWKFREQYFPPGEKPAARKIPGTDFDYPKAKPQWYDWQTEPEQRYPFAWPPNISHVLRTVMNADMRRMEQGLPLKHLPEWAPDYVPRWQTKEERQAALAREGQPA